MSRSAPRGPSPSALDIKADDHATLLERAEVLAGHLEPRAGGAPEVEDGGAWGDELVLLLYLDQLEGGASNVAEALRLAVEEVGGARRAAHVPVCAGGRRAENGSLGTGFARVLAS